MKKTLFMLLCGMLLPLCCHAQTGYVQPFAKDKIYVASSLSGIDLSYKESEKWHANIDVKGGWLFEDNWMLTGTMGYDYRHYGSNTFLMGTGVRYYIEQNGLFLGAGANYAHQHEYDDLLPTIQVGYAFFLNRNVTLEPEIYYNQSLKDHSEYSGIGFRIGLGIYF